MRFELAGEGKVREKKMRRKTENGRVNLGSILAKHLVQGVVLNQCTIDVRDLVIP